MLRVAEHLTSNSHDVIVIAPRQGDGCNERDVNHREAFGVVRVPSLELPHYPDLFIARPSRVVTSVLKSFRPDVVHAAAPVVLGCVALRAARRLGLPSVAVYQTNLAEFAADAIQRVLEADRGEQARRCRQHAQQFSWERTATSMLAVFEQVRSSARQLAA